MTSLPVPAAVPPGTVAAALPAPAVSEPLPLPTVGWGLAQARAAWRAALPQLPATVLAGLAGPAARHRVVPVSALTTVVLRVGPWAVKVYAPGTDPTHLDGIAEGLAGSSVGHLPVAPAVVTEHGVVSVSRWLRGGAPVGWPQVGAIVRRFHDDHAGAALPPWRPLTRVDSQAAGLPAEEAELLRAARDGLVAAVAQTWSELGWGAVHGDLSAENVLGHAGGARLIDLDWCVTGPRELDLAPVARRLRDGEIDGATYLDFCRAYGHDVRGWAGLPLLDRIAELGGVVFRLWDCRHHGRDLDWLPGELRRWRSV